MTCSPEQPPLHQGLSRQNHYLVREPCLGIRLDCPLKHTKSASTCKKKAHKKLLRMAKWSHLRIKWLLERDWDTIRVSSLSSPQNNDVQRVPSYESMDLQANASSLRFSFIKQVFIRRCGRKTHHVWDRCKAVLRNITLKATGPVHDKPSSCPPHKLWLVRVSFLTFLEMSQLPVYLYCFSKKLLVVFYVYRKIKVQKIAAFVPSHFHSSTLIQTQKYSQKILIPVIVFLSYCWWPWKIEIWDNTVYITV